MGRSRTLMLVASVLVPVLVIAGLASQVATHYWMPKYASGEMSRHVGDIGHEQMHSHVQANFFPCTPEEIRQEALYWDDFLRCQQSKPTGPIRVALVGDSHAEQLFLGLAEAFPDTNVAYYILGELPVRSASENMARIIDYVAGEVTSHRVV